MKRTRLSLFYLAGYLLPTGLALVVQPQATMKLLQAQATMATRCRGSSGSCSSRSASSWHMIRVRAETMYPATLAARVVILAGLVGLYLQTRDRFFAVVTAVVAVGFVLTFSSYLADRGAKTPR